MAEQLPGRDAAKAEPSTKEGQPYDCTLYLNPLEGRDAPMAEPSSREGLLHG